MNPQDEYPASKLDPMVIFTDSLKDFNLAFPLFTTNLSHLEVLKEHLRDSYSYYKDTITGLSKFMLSPHTTRIESIVELLQPPPFPIHFF